MNKLLLRLTVVAMLLGPIAGVRAADDAGVPQVIENDVLRVSFLPRDASITVTDKRIGLTWQQQVRSGFHADEVRVTPTNLSAKVSGTGGPYLLTISLSPDRSSGFDLTLDAVDHHHYTIFPGYPFHFVAPQSGWFYVQNTSGEGILMPLDKEKEIQRPFTWGGGQPWWGLTDLKRGVSVRLESFNHPDRPGAVDRTVYALPMRIHCSFFAEGGYVAMAKDFRKSLLAANGEMRPLFDRVKSRPALANLKDGVYVYLWTDKPAEALKLVEEMKAAGVDRGIAMFYGRQEVDRAMYDGIKRLGWVAGMYKMPTGNLFQVSQNQGWVNAILTGKVSAEKVLASSNRQGWDRICGQHIAAAEWPEKAKGLIQDYGLELMYFDTLCVQLAPCLSPDHPSTIEENLAGRLEIMKKTRELGMVVGSGEGINPAWALPQLDFFEGQMSLRTYGDTPIKIPGGDYKKDLGEDYRAQAAVALDQTRRVPLYQLGFHDYVVGTWVWRDTNYQSIPFAWKKDLFNILYGSMPMFHIDRTLWESHKADYVASYKKIASVREKIGFAEMLDHGWLSEDRSVQYTDWDTGDRVIVNFGEKAFERGSRAAIAARSFVIEKR